MKTIKELKDKYPSAVYVGHADGIEAWRGTSDADDIIEAEIAKGYTEDNYEYYCIRDVPYTPYNWPCTIYRVRIAIVQAVAQEATKIKASMNKTLVLKQTLPHAVDGYWDGGAKQVFEWEIEGIAGKDSKGTYVRVGSWGANHWFHVAQGKTDKLTLCNAKQHLRGTDMGKRSKFEYVIVN